MTEAFCVAQDRYSGLLKVIFGSLLPIQHRLGLRVAPWLVRHAAERESRFFNSLSIRLTRGGHRHEGERVGVAVADFMISVIFAEAFRRQINRRDDFIRPQIRIGLRRVSRQSVEFAERYRAVAALPRDANGGFKR